MLSRKFFFYMVIHSARVMYMHRQYPHPAPQSPTARLCLYFGTFAPIHSGHMALARYALEHMPIDELWFVPSPLSPHKDAQTQWLLRLRMSLIVEAIATEPRMRLCPIEAQLPLPHYSVRTLQSLTCLHPEAQLHLLMGADNIIHIGSWYQSERLLQQCTLHVYPRPGYDPSPSSDYHYYPEAPLSPISSTQIRQTIALGQDYAQLLPSVNCAKLLGEYLAECDKLSPLCQ